MKSKKILLLVALEAELGTENVAILSEKCDVRMTGMGKLLAFESTLAAMQQGEYDTIINIGTCGSFRHPFATVLRPRVVAQPPVVWGAGVRCVSANRPPCHHNRH